MTSQPAPIHIGIDVSKARLDIALGEHGPVQRIDNTPLAIRAWLRTLPSGPLHIGCEATGTYHLALRDAVIKAGHPLYLIDGYRLSRYRDATRVRAKTDPIDARLIARYIASEGHRLHPYTLPPEATQRVQQLLRRRATLVRAAVTVRQSLSDLPGFKREVRTLLARFDRLAQQIQAQIVEKLKASDWIDDHRRCQGIEGVGPLSAAALCATFHRGAFTSADAFIAYLGLDVCVRQSGNQNARGTLSKKGDPEVRRLLHNAAMAASRSATWKPFYQACIARGFSCTQALVALARKIARVAFSLMKTGTQYQPGGLKNTCAQT